MPYWTLLLLGILSTVVAHFSLPKTCWHNDVWVKCAPACPKICSEYYRKLKCIVRKCQAGCACREGWVRKHNDMGMCIRRDACTRYIIE